jgi:hypothetical protein
MSYIIRGGYDILRKQVLNISLKPTNKYKWCRGIVSVKENKYVSHLPPLNENNFEIVKYNNMHALLLNNAIIYEDEKLFSYKIELQGFREIVSNDPKHYAFVECNYVESYALKHLSWWRELN